VRTARSLHDLTNKGTEGKKDADHNDGPVSADCGSEPLDRFPDGMIAGARCRLVSACGREVVEEEAGLREAAQKLLGLPGKTAFLDEHRRCEPVQARVTRVEETATWRRGLAHEQEAHPLRGAGTSP